MSHFNRRFNKKNKTKAGQLKLIGEKLFEIPYKKGVYCDILYREETETFGFKKWLDVELKTTSYPSNGSVFLLLNFGTEIALIKRGIKEREHLIINQNGESFIKLVEIEKMDNYRLIADAYGVSEIEFLHLYIIYNTGTGKMMFPAGCFDEIKYHSIYR